MNHWHPRQATSLFAATMVALFFRGFAATLTGNFSSVAAGSNVNLTLEGKLDWVHWGLGGDHAINRKAGVTPLISDFSIVSMNVTNNPLSFSSPYWFDDVASCSWSDGSPVTTTNTSTGVLAYSYPVAGGAGFKLTLPADTTTRILSLYVGTLLSRGEFKATLTGAPNYTDSPASSNVNGVYTLTYAASAPNQTLTVTWTVPFSQTNGNATLQAATLTAPGADNPPFATLTNPTNDSTILGPTNILLNAIAEDFDGTVTNVAFYANTIQLGHRAASPYSFTWSNAPLGHYVLTAVATDNAGVSRPSLPMEVYVYGTNGSQTASTAFPPSAVDLTAEGDVDWVHWGLVTNTSIDRKIGVSPQISNFTLIGSAAVQRYADNYTAYSWSDGTPTPAARDTKTGVFVVGVTNGFALTLPADTIPRKARLYVGAYAARGHFVASLSDFSAQPYIDASINDTAWNNEYAVYEINYAAASPGQQLNIAYRSQELYDQIYGNVTLQAATLQGGPQVALPVLIINPARVGNDFTFSFATQSNRTYTVKFTDSLNPASWQTLTNFAGDGTVASVTNQNVTATERCYRVTTQ